MFSDKTLVELNKGLKIEIGNFKDKIRQLELDAKYEAKIKALDIESAKNEIRKEMQKSLIESDLKRVKAEASLATYEKMDTKTERLHIQKMLDKAIEGLSKAKVQVVK